MKRKEFIRIVTGAMEDIEKSNDFSCNVLDRIFYGRKARGWRPDSTIRKDYCAVFGYHAPVFNIFTIPVGFYEDDQNRMKQVRLNALAMYLAQSLAFKTYKEL